MSSVSPEEYKYFLPRDALRLESKAQTAATYDFIHSSRHLSKREIEEQACSTCKQIKETLAQKILTNNFDLFTKLTTKYYVKYYLILQEYAHLHPQEVATKKKDIQESPHQDYFLRHLAFSIEAAKKRGVL